MALTFGSSRAAHINMTPSPPGGRWRHELAPVIAVAGLFADYLSPAALWTILLPLGCVVLLMALRKWTTAAAVFLLSSWFLVPAAIVTVAAVEDSRGEHSLFALAGASGPLLDKVSNDACPAGAIEVETLPIGPGQLINPHWVLRQNIMTFVAMHNAIVIDRARALGLCPLAD
jgi:hypothetical protein